MPGEGRDLEIGQPINSEECSETAEGVARESEGRSRVSLLRPVRQDQPRGHPGSCLCPVPLQQGRTRYGWSGLRGHRGVWGTAVARRTGACAQAGDLSTGSHQKSVHTESQRQTQATGHLDLAGSGLHDSSDAGAGTDLRSRPSTRTVRLPPRAQRSTGGGRGGSAAGPWPRSEEHTSELQSLAYLVCRLLLEKKKKKQHLTHILTKKKKTRNTIEG